MQQATPAPSQKQSHIIESEQIPDFVTEIGKATSSSDFLPEALCEMYVLWYGYWQGEGCQGYKQMIHDSDPAIGWMMGFAM